MADLFALLNLGAAGLAAQHAGVAVAANNTANVNTVGYSRQRLDLRAELAAPLVGGVSAGSPRRISSELLASRARSGQSALGHSGARAPALADLEAGLLDGGPALDAHLGYLWAGLQRVTATPTDPMVRDAAVAAATGLADAFKQRADSVAKARTEADARINDFADQATSLAADIAQANRLIRIQDDPVQRDRRDVAANKLASLIGGQGRIDPDGQMRWVVAGGAVLVDGDHAARVVATPDPATGYRKIEVVDGAARRDVTASLDGGALAGEVEFRDVDAAAAATKIDQLAFDLTARFNAVHQANAGLDGVAGRDLFVAQAVVAGAASRMAVDPALVADSRRLATAAAGAGPGDNQGVVALLGLRDQLLANGGTQSFGDAAVEVVSTIGRQAGDAKATAAGDAAVAEHVAGLRDSLSGVDLDEELATMVQFQHASEAMTRFIASIDGMLTDLLNRL